MFTRILNAPQIVAALLACEFTHNTPHILRIAPRYRAPCALPVALCARAP
ncbi:hypothetical protein HMPREF9248_0346 [Fannyhessea vaginae PB189-T1-4]|uniref:Uncharacterized protein n=1 Tax=Fannyhessea vaginae PB189-T1-4 TaxID=866774 RepID=A0ABN0B011_9ACTN|nr:hypothetical protein HMPREF9248_0346 [Fannyhessea vaginae PB189-T1-4]